MTIDEQAPEWTELSALLGAYLNQDSPEEYGTTDDTIRAFCQEESPVTVSRATAQARELLRIVHDDDSTRSALKTLGLDYEPSLEGWTHRAWLVHLEALLHEEGATHR